MSEAASRQDHGEPPGQVTSRGEGAGVERGVWSGEESCMERSQGLSSAPLLGALHVRLLQS